jgi:hypothetical protein
MERTMNPPHIATHDDLVVRISAEYLEMPGLRLTLAQALRLWGLDEPTCSAALQTLLESKFLSRRIDGTYARATDGQLTRFSMLKAELAADVMAMPRRRVSRRQES